MITKYFALLYKLFFITPWISITCLILSLITILFIFVISIILFFDLFYRKNLSSSYNFFLDHLMPIIVCVSPTIIIVCINHNYVTWCEKFIYIIIIHISIIIPLIYLWSKHRNWNYYLNNSGTKSWNSPKLYLDIVIAIIYPLIWGVYFSFIRYLRLGNEFDLTILFNNLLAYLWSIETLIILFLIISALLNIIIWLLLLLSIFIFLRSYLWNSFSILIYALHLELLRFTFYVMFMEKIYKLHFIFFNMISLNAPLNIIKDYISFSLFRQIIHNIYYYPGIIYVLLFIFICMEICFFHYLYFSYYIFFLFPIIFSIIKSFNALGRTLFLRDVCMVDYLTHNINKIRYKPLFWKYIEDPELFYGFHIAVSITEHDAFEKEYVQYLTKRKYYSYILKERLFIKINNLQNKSYIDIMLYSKKIKVAYYKIYNIHWNYKIK